MLMAGCRRQGNVTIQLFDKKPNVRQSSGLQNHDPREVVKRYEPGEMGATHALSWNVWPMLEVRYPIAGIGRAEFTQQPPDINASVVL